MALQGDLQSFALPDVLRLLAGTSKTGRLAVVGDDRTGDVWLRDGGIVAGAVSSSPYASTAADVVFELLRFESGTFAFEDGDEPSEPGDPTTVDDAIGRAEELVREWDEVEAVVPSVDSWITMVPEIDGDHTMVSSDQWRLLAIVAGGLSVRDLGDRFSQTDLASSRQVKDLVEAGLVQLGEPPAHRAAPAQSYEPTPAPEPTETDDLSVLRADDAPVVLESSDDALLPEPLPGEGTSFEGDLADMTSVDGRSFASADAPDVSGDDSYASPEPARQTSSYDAFAAFGSSDPGEPGPGEYSSYDDPPPADPDRYVSFEPEPEPEPVGHAEPAPAPASAYEPAFEPPPPPAEVAVEAEAPPVPEPAVAEDPFAAEPFGDDDFFGAPPSGGATEEVNDDPLASTPSTDAASDEAVEGVDADRGALLNFLSTVKH